VNGAAKVLGLPDERLPLPVWLVMTAALVPLAALTHHLIERPARRWLRGAPGIAGPKLGISRGDSALEPAPAR
jgi:peptidoglycan/LPS O-acetylase OafA/YrhL